MDFNKILNDQKAIDALDRENWSAFFNQISSLDLSREDFYETLKLIVSEASDQLCNWINNLKLTITNQDITFIRSHWSYGIEITDITISYKLKWLTFLHWIMFSNTRFGGWADKDTQEIIQGFFDKESLGDPCSGNGEFYSISLYVGIPLDNYQNQVEYQIRLSERYYFNGSSLCGVPKHLLSDVINQINKKVDNLITKLIEKINQIKYENN